MVDGEVSTEEKAKIASRLILLAPPCQFNEVFTDVRFLVDDDKLLQEKVSGSFARYNKEQFIQVKVGDSEQHCLITQHGDLGSGRFHCPRTHQSFRFDHLKREASDVQQHKPSSSAAAAALEPWRVAVEKAVTEYVAEHYRGGPACSIYAAADAEKQIIVCIESHYSRHSTSGRWRSEWFVSLPDKLQSGTANCKGTIKVQTHIYDNGNVQLISSKENNISLKVDGNADQFAKQFVNSMKEADEDYQNAIGEKFKNLSSSTFKSLRRPLPITGEKIQWDKIMTYKVGQDIANA